AIYAGNDEVAERRDAFAAELGRLEQSSVSYKAVAAHQPFYLAYQEAPNRELLARYGTLCSRLMGEWQQRAGLVVAGPARGSRPKKIGMVSAHIQNHSVWNALARGWIEELDPERYELHLFHLGAGRDAETGRAAALAAEFHEGRRAFEEWARLIR